MKHLSFDATISALDAETSALDVETSAIARSYRRYRFGVFGDIDDCGVGVPQQMCNRVTNHGDMGTFSRPGPGQSLAWDHFHGIIAYPCGVIANPNSDWHHLAVARSGKNTHILRIGNSVTHLFELYQHCNRQYIDGNFTPSTDIVAPSTDIAALSTDIAVPSTDIAAPSTDIAT